MKVYKKVNHQLQRSETQFFSLLSLIGIGPKVVLMAIDTCVIIIFANNMDNVDELLSMHHISFGVNVVLLSVSQIVLPLGCGSNTNNHVTSAWNVLQYNADR